MPTDDERLGHYIDALSTEAIVKLANHIDADLVKLAEALEDGGLVEMWQLLATDPFLTRDYMDWQQQRHDLINKLKGSSPNDELHWQEIRDE